MRIARLELEEFRLYQKLSLDFDPSGLVVIGANASGKSSLLEAIAMLATMRSPAASSDRQLINWRSGQELGFPAYARVLGTIERRDGESHVELAMTIDPTTDQLKKSIKVNGHSVRVLDAVGTLNVVPFTPEDVSLTSGSPSPRRRYLDLLISQMHRGYLHSLSRYQRVLEQRNSLLRQLAREPTVNLTSAVNRLEFWDSELIAHGSQMIAHRLKATAKLSRLAKDRFDGFSSSGALSMAYEPNVAEELARDGAAEQPLSKLEADVAVRFGKRIEERRRDELRRGLSLVGPHRDDFTLLLDDVKVGTYGSRGQQRLCVIALKLAEAAMMADEQDDAPVILLDDVLSELDPLNRERLLSYLSDLGSQVIVTAADPALIDSTMLASLPRVSTHHGEIKTIQRAG
jgi:DNA replication and repair protein RecF